MKCNEVKQLIQLYMDNEMDARSTLDVQLHLETCSACRHILDTYMIQDEALKQAARQEPLDSRFLRRKILAAIRRQPYATSARFYSAPVLRRIAAVVLLATVGALVLLRGELLPGASESVYAAAASDHAKHCAIDSSMGAITNSEELGRLTAAYSNLDAPPDLSAFGYGDPRATVCTVKEEKFLHLVYYNQEQQPVSLFVRPHSEGLITSRFNVASEGDYQVASVSSAGIDLLVVASLGQEQTSTMTKAIAAQLKV
ncbi:MAG: zf-HC2 domain-containing protein [Blastocatellia bacterium]|nr:zf-HC2 domain-containing protein [Blastocatellia bacterium]